MTDPVPAPTNPTRLRLLDTAELARLKQQYPRLWLNYETRCETCQDPLDGVFQARYQGQVVSMRCDCKAQWMLHLWLLNAGIGMHYQRLSMYDVTHVSRDAEEAAYAYLESAQGNVSQGQGMTLWSPDKGTGKTLLLTLLIKRLLARGYEAYFVTFQEMLDYYTSTWRDEEERTWFIRKVRNAQVLAVDDIGRESKGRENITEAMFDQVLRPRVAADLPTLITSNLTPSQLHQGYGGNVLSLLGEVNRQVEVPGLDYRPILAEQRTADIRNKVYRPLVVD